MKALESGKELKPSVNETKIHLTIMTFSECGGMLNASSGSLSTPGFPSQSYSDNLNCVWTLSIPTDGFVIIDFLVFDTEKR